MKFQEMLDDCLTFQTRNSYLASMYGMMDWIYKRRRNKILTPIEKEEYIKLIEDYLSQDRNFLQDLIGYRQILSDKAPRTARAYLYNCKLIIEICAKYEFPKEKQRRFAGLVKGTRRPITHDAVINYDIIRKIVGFANIPTKSAILLMCCSGLRIGEAIKLHIDYVDLDQNTIYLPGSITKTHEPRITFITTECAESIKNWLEYRPSYMAQIKKQCTSIQPVYDIDEPRLFPMSDTSLREGIHNAIRNAGLKSIDKNTRRFTINPHAFRKWFSTTAKNVMSEDLVETLMGHELPFSGAYFRMTEEDMRKEYRKYENVFFIGSDQIIKNTLENVGENMSILKRENEDLRNDMQKMKAMIMEMALDKAGIIKKSP